MPVKQHLNTFLGVGRQALQNNAIPAVILWSAVMLIAYGYYNLESIRVTFNSLGSLKTKYGFLFSMCSTALCGALLPYLLQYIKTADTRTIQTKELGFLVALWAFKGLEFDTLYRLQAYLFGNGTDIMTVATKVGFDLFIYGPLWAVPVIVLATLWKDSDYSLSSTRKALKERSFLNRVIPIQLITWFVFFLPAAFAIYVMPPALQIVMQNLALCFFVLLLTFFTGSENTDHSKNSR